MIVQGRVFFCLIFVCLVIIILLCSTFEKIEAIVGETCFPNQLLNKQKIMS